MTMMLVCTTLGYSLPFGMDSDQHSSCSESVSEALSRGSSAILEVSCLPLEPCLCGKPCPKHLSTREQAMFLE